MIIVTNNGQVLFDTETGLRYKLIFDFDDSLGSEVELNIDHPTNHDGREGYLSPGFHYTNEDAVTFWYQLIQSVPDERYEDCLVIYQQANTFASRATTKQMRISHVEVLLKNNNWEDAYKYDPDIVKQACKNLGIKYELDYDEEIPF